jgi:hypothetical protein
MDGAVQIDSLQGCEHTRDQILENISPPLEQLWWLDIRTGESKVIPVLNRLSTMLWRHDIRTEPAVISAVEARHG